MFAILSTPRKRRVLIVSFILIIILRFLLLPSFYSTTHRYWERTGDPKIYDRYSMERLDFSHPELHDRCSAQFSPGISKISPETQRIPRILHYVFGLKHDFDGIGFGIIQYAALRSAHLHLKPDEIILHYRYLPDDNNEWWSLAKGMYTEMRHLENDVTEVFGNPVGLTAHKADVVRMQKLLETGGIYLDSDIIVLKSFDPLLHHDFVMGQEASGEYAGMANAVILSRNDSAFLHRWWDHYKTFNDSDWSYHSVKLPYKLSKEYQHEMCRLPRTAFFYPAYFSNEVAFLFEQDEFVFKENGFQYAFHCSMHANGKYLHGATLEDIVARDNSVFRLLRRYLPEDKMLVARENAKKEVKAGIRNPDGTRKKNN